MRKFFLAVALLSLSVIFAACGGGSSDSSSDGNSEDDSGSDSGSESTEAVELVAHSKWPDENYISVGMREFAKKVDEKTDGKVVLDVQTGGSLGYEGPELLKVVRDGLVPISEFVMSEVAGDEPFFALVTLPFLVPDLDQGEKFYEITHPYFNELLEEKWNQKILYDVPWPYAGFWTQNKVETIDDAQGLKMRTYDENGAKVVSEMGGSPQPLPFSEVYSSLSTGVIDSVLTSSTTAVDAKFWEVLDYYVPTNVTASHDLVTINLDEFNKLDQESQDAIVEAGEEMNEYMWKKVRELDEEMVAKVEEEGITVVEPDEDFMKKLKEIGDEITEEWLQDAPPEAEEIIEKFREEVGQ